MYKYAFPLQSSKIFPSIFVAHLSVAARSGPSGIYEWDDALGQFNDVWSGPPLVDLYPVKVSQRPGSYVLLAEARPLDLSNVPALNIYTESYITQGQSDYVFR